MCERARVPTPGYFDRAGHSRGRTSPRGKRGHVFPPKLTQFRGFFLAKIPSLEKPTQTRQQFTAALGK